MNRLEEINQIVTYSIKNVLPNKCISYAINGKDFSHTNNYALAIGKAAHQMAKELNSLINIKQGIIITKYGHNKGDIDNFKIYEAGHPILDKNSLMVTKKALEFVSNLNEDDKLIFLVSGGGSSLFEESDLSLDELININNQLLKSGANINEINTIRKRISNVKGGRFATKVPCPIYQIVLSDVIGNDLDIIASGPAYKDTSTYQEALNVIHKYNLKLSQKALMLLNRDTPKDINNVETFVGASLKEFVEAAKDIAEQLGYQTKILSYTTQGYAKDVAKDLSSKAIQISNNTNEKTCLIMGGETTVKVFGDGLGGRCQEFALSCAKYIQDKNIVIFSFGSDGSDGPTDAAGGYVDGHTIKKLKELNINIDEVLNNNDSYHALKRIDQLIFTGPTGTNVNDLYIALINPK